MKAYPSNVRIQIDSSAALANMASIEENRVKMLEDGCLGQVLENINRVSITFKMHLYFTH